jgi:hypothetical protein
MVFLLTTIDNPYNPFTQWIEWYMEDTRLGYDTCGLIARMAVSSNLIKDHAEEEAMTDILRYNWSGKHIAVTEQEFDTLIKLGV